MTKKNKKWLDLVDPGCWGQFSPRHLFVLFLLKLSRETFFFIRIFSIFSVAFLGPSVAPVAGPRRQQFIPSSPGACIIRQFIAHFDHSHIPACSSPTRIDILLTHDIAPSAREKRQQTKHAFAQIETRKTCIISLVHWNH